jgi:hypothetical protein
MTSPIDAMTRSNLSNLLSPPGKPAWLFLDEINIR